MEKPAQSTLRIRCEGQLEVLEEGAKRYVALDKALQSSDWALFSGFKSQELAANCAEAQRLVERHWAQDVDGEGRSAIAAFVRARRAVHRQLARRAAQISVVSDGELELIAERVLAHLPIQLETQTRVLTSSRVSGALFQGLRLTLTAVSGLGLVALSSGAIFCFTTGMESIGATLLAGLVLGAAALGVLRGFTAEDSRAAVSFRSLLSRRARLVLSRNQLMVGARRWTLDTISKLHVNQGRALTVTISSKRGADVEVQGQHLEGLVAAMEKEGVPVERSSSPTQSIEAIREAAVRNQLAVRGR